MSNPTELPDLDACPFCGSSDVDIMDREDGLYAAMCNECTAEGPAITDKDAARSGWNRRAQPEGEAPQAEFVPFGHFVTARHHDGSATTINTRENDPDAFVLFKPAAQHAESGKEAPYANSQRKMIERAIIGLRDGWATRKDADDALTLLAAQQAAAPGALEAPSGSIEDYNEFNRLLHAYADEQGDKTYRALVSYIDKWVGRRAAQLDGGQEGSESNG